MNPPTMATGRPQGSRFSDIEDYFSAVEQAVARLPSDVAVKPWRVIRASRVGFFTFFKEVIWRDLDPERWPEKGPAPRKAVDHCGPRRSREGQRTAHF